MNGFPSWVCPLSLLQDSEKLSQVSSMVYMGYYISHRSSLSLSLAEDASSFRPIYKGTSTAFCIQLFFIDEKYEARQVPIPSLSAMERASPGLAGPILSSHRVRGFQAWLPILISGEFFFKLQIPRPHFQTLAHEIPGCPGSVRSYLPKPCAAPHSLEFAFRGDFGFSWSRIF